MSASGSARGFSLLELSIVLVILGLLAVALVPRGTASAPPGGLKQLGVVFEEVNRFYQVNRRLPCPASAKSGGYEVCDLPFGTLPWASLGRAPQDAAQFEWTLDYWVNPKLSKRPTRNAGEEEDDFKKRVEAEAHLRIMEAFEQPNAPYLANQQSCVDAALRRVAFAIVLRLKSQPLTHKNDGCIVVPDSPQTIKSVSLGELESRGLSGARVIY
jgi:prepilin-type N-terminal cleavage/methylation domain-containing protein